MSLGLSRLMLAIWGQAEKNHGVHFYKDAEHDIFGTISVIYCFCILILFTQGCQ